MIRRSIHRHRYHDPASDMLGRPLICWPIFYRRQRQSHKIRHCRSEDWDTVNVFLPKITDIVLPLIYYCRPHNYKYMLTSLSYTSPIIMNIFCCLHCLCFLSFILSICYFLTDFVNFTFIFFPSGQDTDTVVVI